MNEIRYPEPAPSSEERTLAMLVHVLQFFSWFIAPLIILLVKRDSKFVRFNALQAIVLQVCELILLAVAFIGAFTVMFATMPGHQGKGPPSFFFLIPVVIWGSMILQWIVNITIAIYFGIKSYDGQWAGVPAHRPSRPEMGGYSLTVCCA